jgi:hypothetical protein
MDGLLQQDRCFGVRDIVLGICQVKMKVVLPGAVTDVRSNGGVTADRVIGLGEAGCVCR